MTRLAAFLFLVCAVVLPAVAQQAKTGYGKLVIQRWTAMDKCAAAAQKAFPDFTADSNAKREAKVKECLGGQNLPPRAESPSNQR